MSYKYRQGSTPDHVDSSNSNCIPTTTMKSGYVVAENKGGYAVADNKKSGYLVAEDK
jgi:hypothetical protein